MERIFLDVREERAERSGYFVRSDLKELIEKVEKKGEKEVVGLVYDGSFNLELLTKPKK